MVIRISKKELQNMGFDEPREFLKALGDWAYNFNGNEITDKWDVQRFIHQYRKEQLEAKEDCKK